MFRRTTQWASSLVCKEVKRCEKQKDVTSRCERRKKPKNRGEHGKKLTHRGIRCRLRQYKTTRLVTQPGAVECLICRVDVFRLRLMCWFLGACYIDIFLTVFSPPCMPWTTWACACGCAARVWEESPRTRVKEEPITFATVPLRLPCNDNTNETTQQLHSTVVIGYALYTYWERTFMQRLHESEQFACMQKTSWFIELHPPPIKLHLHDNLKVCNGRITSDLDLALQLVHWSRSNESMTVTPRFDWV